MDKKVNCTPACDRIELRSERVRHIIGSIPSGLVRWGNAILLLIFVLLIAAVLYIPYPYGGGESIWEHMMKKI